MNKKSQTFFGVLVIFISVAAFLFLRSSTKPNSITISVPSFLMAPTIPSGSRQEVELLTSEEKMALQRGTIVYYERTSFRPPPNDKEKYLGRIIGLPNEVIEFREGTLHINGIKTEEPYKVQNNSHVNREAKMTVPGDSYLIMTDYRDTVPFITFMIRQENILGVIEE